ncbi:MAG TPA: hypothetical protein VE133_12045 [Candidatus Sulfotelmatobacter sp.]|nr:hypothetical protein [Candidatus Sulfotelmatobacter sp.]
MEGQKQQTSGTSEQGKAPAGKKAERVQSSRYEWESKASDNEAANPKSKEAQSSLMAALGAWLKRFFSSSRDFFDKDDDATPSAA